MKPDYQTHSLIAYANQRRIAAAFLRCFRREFRPHGRRSVALRFFRNYQSAKACAESLLEIHLKARRARLALSRTLKISSAFAAIPKLHSPAIAA
jgi:hypothetical protein